MLRQQQGKHGSKKKGNKTLFLSQEHQG